MNKTVFKKVCFYFLIAFSVLSCKESTLPKPKAQLRLDYPTATYDAFNSDFGFSFDANAAAAIKKNADGSLLIEYPKMKATIYLTYIPVKNNVEALLLEAQKLTYEHVIKADDISEQPFMNPENKVYGMFYMVGGNAATNTQFYATDSTKHFVRGSAYFYAKPNFDSILPAVNYIKNDMRVIMESLTWD